MEFESKRSFEYENGFYLTARESRMARALAHYEIYKQTLGYIRLKGHFNYELVKGDILKTVPDYVNSRPEWRISLLNIDTDVYEPAKTIIEHLAPRVVKGGIIIFDDYGVFAGETKVADEYCARTGYQLRKFNFSKVPSYVIVE